VGAPKGPLVLPARLLLLPNPPKLPVEGADPNPLPEGPVEEAPKPDEANGFAAAEAPPNGFASCAWEPKGPADAADEPNAPPVEGKAPNAFAAGLLVVLPPNEVVKGFAAAPPEAAGALRLEKLPVSMLPGESVDIVLPLALVLNAGGVAAPEPKAVRLSTEATPNTFVEAPVGVASGGLPPAPVAAEVFSAGRAKGAPLDVVIAGAVELVPPNMNGWSFLASLVAAGAPAAAEPNWKAGRDAADVAALEEGAAAELPNAGKAGNEAGVLVDAAEPPLGAPNMNGFGSAAEEAGAGAVADAGAEPNMNGAGAALELVLDAAGAPKENDGLLVSSGFFSASVGLLAAPEVAEG
jgi:hypothetical protein